MKTDYRRTVLLGICASILQVFIAIPLQGALVQLSEDPAYATYYNGARKVQYAPGYNAIYPPIVECYGMANGPADIGAFWTLPTSRVAGESWTFNSFIWNSYSAQMPPDAYAVLQMVFKTADGTLIPYEKRLTEPEVRPESWLKASLTALEPAGATEVSFYVKLLRDDVGNNGGLYFDEISVLSPVPEPWVTGLFALVVIALGTCVERFRRRI